MIIVYGSARSRALRVLWLAEELGLSYKHEDWSPRAPETRSPEYRALNPNGRIPTLVDGNFVLSESMAINIYLARKHSSEILPDDSKQEALVLQWSFWEIDRLDRQIATYYAHKFRLPEAERDTRIAESAWKEISASFDVLDDALGKTGWLVNDQFSLADLNVASALHRALSLDVSEWPRMEAWLTECWKRPVAKRLRALRDG